MILSREQILSCNDRKTEVVQVPEWGGEVIVSAMSGLQRDAFEASLRAGGEVDLTNARAKLVAASVVDENGSPLFTQEHLLALGAKSYTALDRVADVAQRLNKLGNAQAEIAAGN